MATRNATNYTEFAAALAASVSGDIVFIPAESQINMTGQSRRTIPAGVEVRGERGKPLTGGGQSLGGRIYTTSSSSGLLAMGTGSKLRLLRIQGSQPNTNSGTAGGGGITVAADNVLIEWCEISGFGDAGIRVNYTNQAWRTRVTRCFIHNCQVSGWGYGVTVNHGYYIVTFCKFDQCRHAVTGGGATDSSAEVTDCLVLGNNPSSDSHSFDMHQSSGNDDDRSHPEWPAAKLLIYDRNVFAPRINQVTEAHITVRGTPTDHLYIRNNKFWRPTLATALDLFGGGETSGNSFTTVSGNTVGYTGPLVDPSDPTLFWGPPIPPPSSTITCNLTAPANGTVYEAPASISLTATASVTGGATISSVVFKSGSNIIGTGNLSGGVYSFSYTDVPVGTYNFTAMATDSLGNTGTSAVSTVVVTVAPPPPTTAPGWGFSRHTYIMDRLSNFIKRAPYLFKK